MHDIETHIDMQRIQEEADSAMRMLLYAVGSVLATFVVGVCYVVWRFL
jgi:hypothetical protein